MALPGVLGNDANGEGMLLVVSRVAVLNEDLLALKIRLHSRVEPGELLRRYGPVVLTPPDVFLGVRFPDHELVVGRPGAPFPGVYRHGPLVDDGPLPAEDELLVEGLRGEVPVNPLQVSDPVVFQAEIALELTGLSLPGRLDLQKLRHVSPPFQVQSRTSLRLPR